MRNIKKFAKENGYKYSLTTDDYDTRTVRLETHIRNYIVRDKESDAFFSIHGWHGDKNIYALSSNSINDGRSITYMTQKEIIMHIKNVELEEEIK